VIYPVLDDHHIPREVVVKRGGVVFLVVAKNMEKAEFITWKQI
jgi:hypothetical protein